MLSSLHPQQRKQGSAYGGDSINISEGKSWGLKYKREIVSLEWGCRREKQGSGLCFMDLA